MDRCQSIVIKGRSIHLPVKQCLQSTRGRIGRLFPAWNVEHRASVSGMSISDIGVRWASVSGNMSEENNQKRGNPGLKQLREMAKLNRQDMAKATGVHVRMWQRYENEGRLPEKVETLVRIAVLAGTSIDEAARMVGYQLPTRDELLAQIENAQTT